MRLPSTSALVALLWTASGAAAAAANGAALSTPPDLSPRAGGGGDSADFNAVIYFGDSYTDQGTRQYRPRGDGLVEKPRAISSTGGRVWPQYVHQYTGARTYSYAIGGSVCDRTFSPGPRHGFAQDQVPAFLADMTAKADTSSSTSSTGQGEPASPAGGDGSQKQQQQLEPVLNITSQDTIYAIWIGVNDIGPGAFLTDVQPRGMSLTEFPECVYDQIETLYRAAGARRFVLINVPPLYLAPMYAPLDRGGIGFMRQYDQNVTQSTEKLRQYVSLVNEVYKFRTAYAVVLGQRYPGAEIVLFDVNSLLTDIYENPTSYLNGTKTKPDVTGYILACGKPCADHGVRDSYMWYDALHPSEQTDRIIAKEFVSAVRGRGSKWAKYFRSP